MLSFQTDRPRRTPDAGCGWRSAVRIASFNVENLFQRARALDPSDWQTGRPVLERQARVNTVLGQPEYSDEDKAEIVVLLDALGLSASDLRSFVVRRSSG